MIEFDVHDDVALLVIKDVVTPGDYEQATALLDQALDRTTALGVVIDPSAKHQSAPGAKKVFIQWMLARQERLTEVVAASAEVVEPDRVEPGRSRLAATPFPWPAELFATRAECERWVREQVIARQQLTTPESQHRPATAGRRDVGRAAR